MLELQPIAAASAARSRPRILSVGQCGFDDAAIRVALEAGLSAEVERAGGLGECLERLRHGSVDLVLVNRKLDADGSDGVALIRSLRAAAPHVPVMLVSNYADAQAQAVAAGALPGFGKGEIGTPVVAQRCLAALESRRRDAT
jgi:CheY-like chemotaxis protein